MFRKLKKIKDMPTNNNQLQQLVKNLFSVSERIQKGEKGKDFCIESDENGIDQYDYTDIENEFEKITRDIVKLVKQDPECLTISIYLDIKKAFDNSSKAKDSFRGRTPAFGGDWQDIDSIVMSESSYTANVLKEIAFKLKENDHSEFKDVPDGIINDMY